MLIGGLVTCIVIVLTGFGLLAPLERTALDYRFRYFQNFSPPPTNRVVHIDIDDGSLKTIGRWPWPRSQMAAVVDELKNAGATVIAFDVLFVEPQESRIVEKHAADSATPLFDRVDDDEVFAKSVAAAGNVLLPIAMKIEEEPTTLMLHVRSVLRDDVELQLPQIITRLGLNRAQAMALQDVLGSQKAWIIRHRLQKLFDESPDRVPTLSECRAAILPKLPPHVIESNELTTLRDEYGYVSSVRYLRKLMRPVESSDAGFAKATDPTVPIAGLARSAATTGFVTFDENAYRTDSVLRSIPLWLRDEQNLWPQIALAAGCMYLKVPLDKVRITPDETVLPGATMPDGKVRDVHLKTMERRVGDGWYSSGGQILIPWQSNSRHWQYLFDPLKLQTKQHLPIGTLIELNDRRRAVAFNDRSADVALLKLMTRAPFDSLFRPEMVQNFDRVSEQIRQAGLNVDKALVDQRVEFRRRAMEELNVVKKDYEATKNLNPQERDELKALKDQLAIYADAVLQVERGRERISDDEHRFKELVDGTVCLIGWTGTGTIADFVPTSLEPKVPGVAVHGAILNAMLTGHFIGRAPVWADLWAVALMGLLTALIASSFGPEKALGLMVLIIGTFFAINAVLLFDYLSTWAAAAGPIVAAVSVWAALTVFRLLLEQRQRARITRQFKNYVAPDLVDFLVDNPNVVKLEGERREMTCMFSDIAGFTTLSEHLGPEGTVNLLNTYLATATDALMTHRATVNKYLGDGIMAFWGAPIHNPNHAYDACMSVLAMLEALNKLADETELKDMPKLFTRMGVCTGAMMVGDCGAPPRRSDYTVIGDPVNLASRLENANKQFGTQMLISDHTQQLVRDRMLTRPIGRIVVVGRKEYETVHELLNTREKATEFQQRYAAATATAVEAFIHANFSSALGLFDELATHFGPSPLIKLYREACLHHIDAQTEPESFNGALVLTEK